VSDERGGAGLDGPAKPSFTVAPSPLPGDETSVCAGAEAGCEGPGGAGYKECSSTDASGCCPGSSSLHVQLHLDRVVKGYRQVCYRVSCCCAMHTH